MSEPVRIPKHIHTVHNFYHMCCKHAYSLAIFKIVLYKLWKPRERTDIGFLEFIVKSESQLN